MSGALLNSTKGTKSVENEVSAVGDSVEAQGPWPQAVTLSATIANGGTTAISAFEYKSGTAFSALTATVRRITVINKSGGVLSLIGDGEVNNDIELPLDDDESYTLFVTDASKVQIKNSSGGDLVCYAIVEGTFAEAGA